MLNPKLFFVCLFILLSLSESSEAQMNLVPNPSFEIHDSCPDNLGQIHKAVGWKGLLVTPDYHHICATYWRVLIPQNIGGYQAPISIDDSAYLGITTSLLRDSVREIVGIALSQPLLVGQKYYTSFLISAGSSPGESPCFCNRFGFKFITYLASLTSSNKELIDNMSHFYTDSIISDTLYWNYIKGNFIADSAYTDVLFGNFFTTDNLDSFCIRSTMHPRTYYYVDRICISTDSTYCDLLSGTGPIPKQDPISVVFAKDGVEIYIIQERFRDMVIYDLSGRMIMNSELNPGINFINFNHLSSGMYLMRIEHYTYKFIR
jgi:hypothetical protein